MKPETQQKLAEGVRYYSQDPSKRSVTFGGGCYYSGSNAGKPDSEGCMIGRMLNPQEREYVDYFFKGADSSDVATLMQCAIDGIIDLDHQFLFDEENKYVLTRFQELHDNNNFWTDKGLSFEGVKCLKGILDSYPQLDRSLFEEFIN